MTGEMLVVLCIVGLMLWCFDIDGNIVHLKGWYSSKFLFGRTWL